MENGKMEELEYFADKKVKVIFVDGKNSDGTEHYSKKEGWIIDSGKSFIILQRGQIKEAISTNTIIRIEEVVE